MSAVNPNEAPLGFAAVAAVSRYSCSDSTGRRCAYLQTYSGDCEDSSAPCLPHERRDGQAVIFLVRLAR